MSNYLIHHLLGPHEGSNKTFLILQDRGEISYRAFITQVNQYANYFTDSGLNPGDRVMVQVEKSWQALAIYAAAIKAGGVFLPLNTAYTGHEVTYFIKDATPRFLICDDAVIDTLQPLSEPFQTTCLTLNEDGSGSLAEHASQCETTFEPVHRDADDLAAILYTSGTTGRAKGAMLSHENLWSNSVTLNQFWQFSESDTLLHALPIYHTHGLFVATNVSIIAGAKMIFLPRFEINEMIEQLPNANCMMGVPTFYTRLLGDKRFDGNLVEHFRLFVSGSAPLLAETHIEFTERCGHKILERYGMTETNMNTSNPYNGDRRAGTVGPALPGISVRVTDAGSGNELPWGEIGQVEVLGPNVFKGYWNMPEKTAEEFTDDGYFITGDLGIIDEQNYLSIVGRNKDLIISGGFNIYPKEIELVLDALEGVNESAVIGIPHPDFGEGVVAVLTGNSPPDGSQVKSLIQDQLAKFKQPKRVFHLQQLPRNAMGKVQKNVLREQFAGCFDS